MFKRSVTVLLAVSALGLFAVSSASAEALAPWWGLSSGSHPTNLQPGLAADEVQEIAVDPGTAFELRASGNRDQMVGLFETSPGPFAGAFPPATAANIQAALEAVYGTGNMVVSGGPGGVAPLKVTSVNNDAYHHVAPLATPIAFGGKAEAKVLTLGGSDGAIILTAQNRGDASTSGAVTIADQLPAGLEAVGIEAVAGQNAGGGNRGSVACSLATLTCTFEGTYLKNGEGKLIPKVLPPYEEIEMRIAVNVKGASSGELNTAAVSGGGAGPVTASHAIEVGGRQRFGIEDYQLIPENVGGSVDTRAGSHPFQLTSVVTVDSQTPDPQGNPRDVALPKDIVAELPVGLVGNPTPFAQCTDRQFTTHPASNSEIDECPPQSALGAVNLTFNEPYAAGFSKATEPVFNLTPLPGEPARFGFLVDGLIPVILDTSVRTGKDYGVTVTSANITQIDWLLSAQLTFWGVPGDARHDRQRGWECIGGFGTCTPSIAASPPPFLVLPTSCEKPYESTIGGDSWAASGKPSEQAEPLTYRLPEALDGCERLPFAPSIKVAPDVPSASTSSGLTADVHVPQTAELNPEGLAESSVRDITVALPEGVALNPAGAGGLEACSEAQIGFVGKQPGKAATNLFTPGLAQPFCPDAAKIGEVTITTPLLPNKLKGAVYLAAQDANPFGSLVAMYIVAEDPVSGTLVKLPGEVSLNQATGQVTATFLNSPQLPFEDAELHFFGGERAPLGTPAHCGTYTTNASFVPWSGNAPVSSQSSFQVTSGPGGGACPGAALPFSPTLTGGTVNNQAGSFSAFTMTMSREDGQQNLKSIELHMPPGLSGVLSGVPLCGEAQADAGTCPAASLIGETTVSVGLGGSPFAVKGGQVFLTGPYRGAPFGLSIVNPAKAGPFDLGKVIVRAKLEVNPISAAVTVTSDSSGPYAIPPILDGIPLEIKHVNVTINRPGGFTFNPTNCSPQALTGKLDSVEGATQTLSVPFQATNCAVLKFAPKFAVSTSGKTSRAKGASLNVKLTYPNAPFGSQANIARVKVNLPKQLPSRLTTLQKACTAAQFEANPAGCPAASFIGHAKAITPLIPVPLEGPAIFVSHGGEAFPSLIIVLQGYGVTLELVGSTFISKSGITSSTFKTVPDAPVGSFELNLPEGKYSALAANGNLCKTKLAMPTEFLAQNGAKINESTKISVTGCSKAVRHERKKKHTKRKKK